MSHTPLPLRFPPSGAPSAIISHLHAGNHASASPRSGEQSDDATTDGYAQRIFQARDPFIEPCRIGTILRTSEISSQKTSCPSETSPSAQARSRLRSHTSKRIPHGAATGQMTPNHRCIKPGTRVGRRRGVANHLRGPSPTRKPHSMATVTQVVVLDLILKRRGAAVEDNIRF